MSAHITAILVIFGVLTASTVALIFAPAHGLRYVFGDDTPDVVTATFVRHWGLLVALVGGLLIYAGYHPGARMPILVAAATEKIAGGIIFGTALPRRPALMLVIGADALMALVCLFLLFNGEK